MPGHDIIVVGASAGGVEAISRLAADLPSDLPASLFVVHHFPPTSVSVLPDILNRRGPLCAANPEDGEEIRPGRIYVAPPDFHVLVKPGLIRLAHGPRENGHRPAVDPLFRTAALAYGRRVVGVILSGTLDDGTAGLAVIRSRGGMAVVQDPKDALYPGMPRSALENVGADYVLPLDRIGSVLVRLAHEEVDEGEMPMPEEGERDIAEGAIVPLEKHPYPGPPSVFTCPECGGALWEFREGELMRFRCHVGHGYTAEALLDAQSADLEMALWSALRALEENAALARRMEDRAREKGHQMTAERFERHRSDTEQRADLIRNVLTSSKLGLEGNGDEPR